MSKSFGYKKCAVKQQETEKRAWHNLITTKTCYDRIHLTEANEVIYLNSCMLYNSYRLCINYLPIAHCPNGYGYPAYPNPDVFIMHRNNIKIRVKMYLKFKSRKRNYFKS